MNARSLIFFMIIVALAAAAWGGYAAGNLIPAYVLMPGLPPLTKADVPAQTQNEITVEVQSAYADALRVLFVVRTSAPQEYAIGGMNLKDTSGEIINASTGFQPLADGSSLLEFNVVAPIQDRLHGALELSVTHVGGAEALADFSFPLDLPIQPAQIFKPAQNAGFIRALVDRVTITPAWRRSSGKGYGTAPSARNMERWVACGSKSAPRQIFSGRPGLPSDPPTPETSSGGRPG